MPSAARRSCAGAELTERIGYLQNAIGGVPGPFDSFLTLRGIKTLALRMERHCANALAIAQFLEQHPEVERVYYPGLASHSAACAGAAADEPAATAASSPRCCAAVWPRRAGRSSAASCSRSPRAWAAWRVSSSIPAIMTHASLPAAMRAALGISDGLIRLSVGVEDVEDLIAELRRALG